MLRRICASEMEAKGRNRSGGAPGWGAECLSLSRAPDAETVLTSEGQGVMEGLGADPAGSPPPGGSSHRRRLSGDVTPRLLVPALSATCLTWECRDCLRL